ncbi:MFS-type transporter SLC18B1-like isoform X1 [Dermacentor albipictus]|uniref:MFS-type transporter SLC18B1-like isoform X1 n=1 Tax=Dermacentor albipictus TaxID=60249 RepID=UPI0031FD2437
MRQESSGAAGGGRAVNGGSRLRDADLPTPPGCDPSSEEPHHPHGPLWSGHRTFLSIYRDDDGKLFTHRESSFKCNTGDDDSIAWLWMVVWCNCFIIMGMSLQGFSLQSLASRHGLTYFDTGSLFSATKATAIVGSLLSHSLMSVIYPSHLLVLGVVLKALAVVALGALHWLPVNETAFMALGATIKSVGGVGLALYFTAMYSVLFYKHQSSYIVPLILSEVAVGIGGLLGPILGFELIEVWIYPLPYFAVGGCMLLGILIAVALPLDSCVPLEKTLRLSSCSAIAFLADARVLVDLVTLALGGITMAHFDTTLIAHLTSMNESDPRTDYSFAVVFGGYAIGAILFGVVTAKFEADALVIFVAQLVSCAAFLFVGPVQFIPIPAKLWLTRLGIGLAGFAAAGQFLPVIARVVHSATWRNQSSDLWTITAAVAVSYAACQLGGLAASLFSAYVADVSGPAAACTVLFIIQASWAVARFLVWITECAMHAHASRMS